MREKREQQEEDKVQVRKRLVSLLPFKIWCSLVITPNNTMQQHNDSGLDLDNLYNSELLLF